MAKRKSLSIKAKPALGLGRPLSARCRPQKTGDGMGSAAIDAGYTAMERLWDHIGMPERATPILAPPPRRPWRDPVTLPVAVSPEVLLLRAQRARSARLVKLVEARRKTRHDAHNLEIAERQKLVDIPIPPEPARYPALIRANEKAIEHGKRHAQALTHARELAKAARQAMVRAKALA